MHTPSHLPGLLIPRCSSIPKPTVLPPYVHSQLMIDLCFYFTEKMHEIRRNQPHTVLSVSDHSVSLTITRHVLLLSISKASLNTHRVDACPLCQLRTLFHKHFFLLHDFIPLHSDMLLTFF